MKEALIKAARKNPKSPLANVVRNVEQAQNEERHAERKARELGKLGGRFEYVGKVWLNHKMGNSVFVKTLREEWKELPPLLANIDENNRAELVAKLAKGLMLWENINSSYDILLRSTTLKNPLKQQQRRSYERKFSPEAQLFLAVVGEISGNSQEQQASFLNSMSNSRKLPQGLVSLDQTFPLIGEYLVQPIKNRPQSPRLS